MALYYTAEHLKPAMSRDKALSFLEIIVIVVLAVVPVFLTYPYRVNIFISWEGAYRMSKGDIPFKDFGIPMGYMFWAVPAFFFKIFGPQMITLIKAQAFLNILSGLSFRSILRSFRIPPVISFVSVLYFVLTYSLVNFWPWYNHTVIVYEFVSLAFLVAYMLRGKKIVLLLLAAFFGFLSFFTKQDGGGLCLMMSLVLISYDAYITKDWKSLLIYILAYAAIAALFILPLSREGFSFWFNLGQPPHSSRVSLTDVFIGLIQESQALRLSIIFIAMLGIALFIKDRNWFLQKDTMLFLLLVLGILAQATILQETSYTPPDNNIYFMSFVFVWLLFALSQLLPLPWNGMGTLLCLTVAIFFMQSGRYAGYVSNLLLSSKQQTGGIQKSGQGENVVGRKNFLLYLKKNDIPVGEWVSSELDVFRQMKMPKPTADGVNRIMAMDEVKKNDPKILNMTELTPLAAAIPYGFDKGTSYPLWHHLGVAMFNQQAEMYEKRSQKNIMTWSYLNISRDSIIFFPSGSGIR